MQYIGKTATGGMIYKTDLIGELTAYARSLEIGNPKVVLRPDGVLELRGMPSKTDYRGEPAKERHYGFIGLPKEGIRRLKDNLKRLADNM